MEVLINLYTIRQASSLDSFDFSTLYTNIPHNLLRKCMTKLITGAYSCRNANYIQIHSGRAEACWGTDTSTCNKAGTYSLTDDQVIELLNFLIDNINLYPCRIIGFSASHRYPDCAPVIAFFEKINPHGHSVPKKFNKTFRYIDDLLMLNNPRFFNSIGPMNLS